MERLQKVIAQSGFSSRRKAEEYIKQGKVKVNGKIITELGTKVNSSDEIEIDNKILEKEGKEYYLLNKPRGVITSTNDEKGRKTVIDYINTNARIYPVGRLDYDTTGAILLTNDGEFSNIITDASNKIPKVYIAKLNRLLEKEDLMKLKKGIILDNKKIIPDKVKIKKVNKNNTCIVEIRIHEGINREIKRLFEAIGYDVEKLKRERIANLTLEGLPSGTFRPLTIKEVHQIYALKK